MTQNKEEQKSQHIRKFPYCPTEEAGNSGGGGLRDQKIKEIHEA